MSRFSEGMIEDGFSDPMEYMDHLESEADRELSEMYDSEDENEFEDDEDDNEEEDEDE